jgi:hypothetical protein
LPSFAPRALVLLPSSFISAACTTPAASLLRAVWLRPVVLTCHSLGPRCFRKIQRSNTCCVCVREGRDWTWLTSRFRRTKGPAHPLESLEQAQDSWWAYRYRRRRDERSRCDSVVGNDMRRREERKDVRNEAKCVCAGPCWGVDAGTRQESCTEKW